MLQAPSPSSKVPTTSPQPSSGKAARRAGRPSDRRPASGRVLTSGTGRAATRGGGEVIELEHGITVYPAREEHGRWRAVWQEGGKREQCEAASEEKLAAKLEKVTERLRADAPNMRRPGADLIAHYLNPDRLPVKDRWSRKHAHTHDRADLEHAAGKDVRRPGRGAAGPARCRRLASKPAIRTQALGRARRARNAASRASAATGACEQVQTMLTYSLPHDHARMTAAAVITLWAHAASAVRDGSVDEARRIAAFLTGQLRVRDKRYAQTLAPLAARCEEQRPGYQPLDSHLRDVISAAARWCAKADPAITPTIPHAAGPTTCYAIARWLVTQPDISDWTYRGTEDAAETHLVIAEMSDGSRRVLRDKDVRTGDPRWGYTGTGAHDLSIVLLADILAGHRECPTAAASSRPAQT
jgi:hypothetical protein